MVIKPDEVLHLISANRDKISKLGVAKVGLFGSFSRGEQNKDSDVDLLVEFSKNKKNFRNYMNFVKFAENLLGREVEVVTLESLSPYIAPYVQREIKYVQTA